MNVPQLGAETKEDTLREGSCCRVQEELHSFQEKKLSPGDTSRCNHGDNLRDEATDYINPRPLGREKRYDSFASQHQSINQVNLKIVTTADIAFVVPAREEERQHRFLQEIRKTSSLRHLLQSMHFSRI